MRKDYEETKDFYDIILINKRISELLLKEQEKLGLNQEQMAQKLDMPFQTYKRLSSPKNICAINLINLVKILKNSKITTHDVFSGIYD